MIQSVKTRIHPTAVIHPGAEIAGNVEVGAYSVIGEDVKVGKGTRIGPHVVIEGITGIGEDCNIFQFASLGAPPQDKKYMGEKTKVIIGNNNIIREFVTINRGTAGGTGKTEIGDDNLLMAYVHIAHDCSVGNFCVLANAATLAGHIEIDDYAIVGGLVAIHQFVRIGRYSIIGGASAITKDVLPYCTVAGNRAKLFGLNKIGLTRNGFSTEEIDILERAYKMLFRSNKTVKKAVSDVKEALSKDSIHVGHLIDFISTSERGITR